MKDTPSVCSLLIPLLHNTQKMSLEEAELEYRSDGDDAWYSVTVVLEENGDVLRVKYCGFSEEHDKVYRGSELKSKSELRQVMDRFRPLSAQLQDSDCTNLSLGDVVCASFSFLHDDVRFYDAVLDGVSLSLSLSLEM